MAWRTWPLQFVLSGGPVTPTPIREFNGLNGENRGPFKGRQASAWNSIMGKLTIIGSDNGLGGAKPLPEPMLENCELDPYEQTSVTFYRNSNIFIE